MKKLTSIVLVALLSAASLTACGGNSAETDSKTNSNNGSNSNVVSVFHRWPEENGKDTYKEMFDIVQEKLPDIAMKIDCVPNDMYEVQLTVRMSSAEAPDIFATWPGGRVEAFVANGSVKDISDLWEEADFDNIFIPAAAEGCTHFDGKKYVVPMTIMPNTIYYNVHKFEELNLDIPTTWEDLMSACEAIKQSGTTPFVVGAQGARWGLGLWFDYLLLNTAGGEFRENLMQGKESWESEEVYKAFELWKEMIDKGYFNTDFAAIDPNQIPCSYIAQGKAAMFLNGPWYITNLENVGFAAGDDFDSFTFPQIDPNVEPSSEGCIEAWAVNANTKSYDACKQVLIELSSKEVLDCLTNGKLITNPRTDLSLDSFSEGARIITENLQPQYEEKTLHNNFELATIPAMQEAGLNAFVEFMGAPDTYKDICARLQQTAEAEFSK